MEILAGGMDDYFKQSGIDAKKVWDGKFGVSNFQIWEINNFLPNLTNQVRSAF